MSKVLADGKATCYVSALNRSMAQDASSIPSTTPADVSLTTDVVDITFLLPLSLWQILTVELDV